MPNTLAHVGVQALLSRPLLRPEDFKHVLAGLMIPDVPWIVARLARSAPVDVTYYDVLVYTTVQASLVFCLVLAAGLAAFTRAPGRVFLILAGNALLHLLLDATQIKWGSEVHLLAPVSWRPLGFDLFWPEEWPSAVLTLLGLVTALYAWWRWPASAADLRWPGRRGLALAALALAVYLAAPLALMDGPVRADSRSLGALGAEERTGRTVRFDRVAYGIEDGTPFLVAPTREVLRVDPPFWDAPGLVSVQARFVGQDTLRVDTGYRHVPGLRDGATTVGLAFILAYWLRVAWSRTRSRTPPGSDPRKRRILSRSVRRHGTG